MVNRNERFAAVNCRPPLGCPRRRRIPTHAPVCHAWRVPLRILGLLGLFGLAACGPILTPTAPPLPPTPSKPSPNATSTLAPTRPTQPTWTPSPEPTATPIPTATPPWPTALPTPTAAPPLRPDVQVGTFFFYWYDCPANNCNAASIYAVPPGWAEPLPGDPNTRDGVYYSSSNRYWYLQELRDMRLAGIDIVLPVDWGEHPAPWFKPSLLQGLVEANRRMDPPLRIGLFDDTTSEVSEYRDYADNQEFDGSAYSGGNLPLNLADPSAGFFFYDRKIKPFFQLIPQEMWATHDGRPLEEGGRPLIVVYTTGQMTHLEYAGAVWTGIKEAFQRDFHDRNGQPITPFVILESSWFTEASRDGEPSIGDVTDGRYDWGTALHGPLWHTTIHGYTVASAGPGFDNRKVGWVGAKLVRPRDRTLDGQPGDPGTFLRWSLARIPSLTNLLLIETWNELWEGTNVCRATYPDIAGQAVPEDYYLDLLRQALRGQGLWWAAQPLPPSWPTRLIAGQSCRLTFSIQNTGTRTWSSVGGERLVLSSDLFPGGYTISPTQPVRPDEVGQFAFTFTVPTRAGPHTLTWQMAGPEGPFGPPATWTVQLVGGSIVPALRVYLPSVPIRPNQPLTLTLELAPAALIMGMTSSPELRSGVLHTRLAR